jgi:hypothetical protein
MPHKPLLSRRAWAAACLLLLLVLWLVSSAVARVTAWGAVWEQEEYRFTFRDRHGRPVEGVQLRVENHSGTNFYHFPVTDYLPGQVPTSDAGGVCVFHNVSDCWYWGLAWWLFGAVPMGDHHAPAFVCRFFHQGRAVHRVSYNDLVNTGEGTVRRRWKWLTRTELREKVFGGVAWEEMDPPRVFDLNRDGRIDREEASAKWAAYFATERAWQILDGRKPEWEELEFRLVKRTVVLDLP